MEINLERYSRKQEVKTSRPENRIYELRKKIANLVDKPLGQIMGLTRGMSEYDLNGCLVDALAYKENPGARCWNIIKELRRRK